VAGRRWPRSGTPGWGSRLYLSPSQIPSGDPSLRTTSAVALGKAVWCDGLMPVAGSRLDRRIARDFPEPGSAPEVRRLLDELPSVAGYDPEHLSGERVRAAIVLLADGSISRFRDALRLAATDWRDLLVAAGLAHADWADLLDRRLGPETEPEPAQDPGA
jgi:hypothetical protein